MELLDPAKLTALFSVIAYGLIARAVYRRIVNERREEVGETILWALPWSAILSLLYTSVAAWLNGSRFYYTPASVEIAFLCNMIWSAGIGFLLGLAERARKEAHKRALDTPPQTQNPKMIRRAVQTCKTKWHSAGTKRVYQQAAFDFLSTSCRGKWVIVEMKDKRAYMGWIREFDADEERVSTFHIVIGTVRIFDLNTGQRSKDILAEKMLVSIVDVRAIRL